MEFNGGWRTDERISDSVSNSWRYAKNILLGKGFKTVSNDYGFSKDITNNDTGIIIGVCKLNIQYVLFKKYDDGFDTISIVKNGIEKIILKSKYLNFNYNNPIEAVFKYLYNNNLIIAFTDNYNPPRILNLDCLPFSVDTNKELINSSLINLINLFPEFCQPNYNLNEILDEGGKIKTGVYFISGNYQLLDNTETTAFHISNPISVVKDKKFNNFNNYDGDVAETITTKSIKITYTNLDLTYNKLNVIIISKIAGIIRAFKVATVSYINSNYTYIYTGFEIHEEIAIEEVLLNNINYTHVKTLTTLNDQLIFGNVKTNSEIDFQKYANNIKVNWCVNGKVSINNIKNSYKDEKFIFFNKNFRTDEVYAFYIDFPLLTGGFSQSFLISGRKANIDDKTLLIGIHETEINQNIKNFQLYSTAKSDGTMGYWENETEFYPDDDCYDVLNQYGKIDTLRNLNVRHHRFPSLSQLTEWGYNFAKSEIVSNPQSKQVVILQNYNYKKLNLIDNLYYNTFDTITVLPDNFIYNQDEQKNYIFKSLKTTKLKIDFNLSVNYKYHYPILNSFLFFKIKKIDILNNTSYLYFKQALGLGNVTQIFNDSINLNILEGEQIVIETNILAQEQPISFGDFTISDLESVENNITSNLLGIKLSDIFIPEEIKNKICGFRISYAKRTTTNSLVIGQSILFSKDWEVSPTIIQNEARFHSFDMLYNKYDIQPDYFKSELILNGTSENYVQYNNINNNYNFVVSKQNLLRKITEFNYVPYNLPIPNSLNINNEAREEFIDIKFNNNYEILDYPNLSNKRALVNLLKYRVDCYKNFQDQELISTGIIFDKNLTSINCLQSGDTFVNAYGVRLYGKGGLGGVISDIDKIFYFICESNNNINFRHEGLDYAQLYYPKSIDLTPIIGLPPGSNKFLYSNYFGYNSDYTSLNDFQKNTPFYCDGNSCNELIFEFPQRVHISAKQNKESFTLNWRKFLTNNYYEMPKDKGVIWKVATLNKTLIIHHEHSLFIDKIKDKLGANLTEIYLGVGELFDREPDNVIDTEEGYAGCQSQWAAFVCKLGYIFPDKIQGKWFLFNGQLTEISNNGNRLWFEDNLQTINKDIDNPFTQSGLCAGYDEKFNRLIISKNDGENSWTLSYLFSLNSFICFHDYIANYIFNNRNNIYSVNNKRNNGVFKHNQIQKKVIYYDNFPSESIIDIPFRIETGVLFENFILNSEVQNNNKGIEYDKTITHYMIYNNHQCSGLIEFKNITNISSNYNARNVDYLWFFNNFIDKQKVKNLPILNDKFELIISNITEKKAWFNQENFISNIIVIRLIYDNIEQNDFYLKDLNININKTL